jgi:hypothetical protein
VHGWHLKAGFPPIETKRSESEVLFAKQNVIMQNNPTNIKSDKLRALAKDLTREEPRAPDEEIGGFPKAARVLDKCRASLVGLQGEYQFGCPFDQSFFQETVISQEDFKEFVATGASDAEVGEWLGKNAHAPTH